MSNDPLLLDYAINPTPDPLQASLVGADANIASLQIVISNGGHHSVKVKSITFTLPVGSNPKDLTTEISGIHSSLQDGWAMTLTGSQFTLTPTTASGELGGDSVSFTLKNITVNDKPGTIDIHIREETDKNPIRQGNLPPLAKFPNGFAISELQADPLFVDQGGNTTLSWQGSEGADYTLEYQHNHQHVKLNDLHHTWSHVVENLQDNPMIFFLKVHKGKKKENRITVVRERAVVVNIPPPPPPDIKARSLTVAKETTLLGKVSIGTGEPEGMFSKAKLKVLGPIRTSGGVFQIMKKLSIKKGTTAGWYRIAQQVKDYGSSNGIFEIIWDRGAVRLAVGSSWNQPEGAFITILNSSSITPGYIQKVRLNMDKTNNGGRYVEFYYDKPDAVSFDVYQLAGYGWSLIDPKPGNIPTDFIVYELPADVLFATRSGYSNSPFVINREGNVSIGVGATSGTKLNVVQPEGLAIKVEPDKGKTVYVGAHPLNSLGFDSDYGQILNSTANLYFNIDSNDTDNGGRFIEFRNQGSKSLLMKIDKKGIYTEKNYFRFFPGEDNTWQSLRFETSLGQMWEIPSDRNLKKDIVPIDNPLDKVNRLSGVTYRWNENGLDFLTKSIEDTISAGPNASEEENCRVWDAERNRRQAQLSGTYIGLVAQDVERVVPDVVETDKEGYKSIHYERLVPLLVEAIKEQADLIKGLNARVTNLEAKATVSPD